MRKDFVDERGRSEWLALINEWVHDEVDRLLLARYLLDGLTVEQCAEEIGMSARHTARRLKRARNQLSRHA